MHSGRRLHLICNGTLSPTVVIEAGASSFAIDFTLVQQQLARTTRVCAYDRAGHGWSDPAPSAHNIASDLNALLRVAGERLFTFYNGEGVAIGALTAEQYRSTIPPGSVTFRDCPQRSRDSSVRARSRGTGNHRCDRGGAQQGATTGTVTILYWPGSSWPVLLIDMSVTITAERPDTADAQALIAELEAHLQPLYPRESRHGYSVEKLLAEGVAFFIIRHDGTPAGCGGIQLFGREYGEVKRMYVAPRFRGLGLARLLLDRLEEHARRHGVQTLRLETGIHQHEAIRLYEGMGFRRISPFGDYREDPLSRFYEKQIAVSTDITANPAQ